MSSTILGAGTNTGRASRFTMSERNLGLMQEIIRKDPESYKEEFLEQFNHFVQTMKLLQLQPEQHKMEMQPLMESVLFLSGLAKHYPKESKQFSDSLLQILKEQGAGLDPDVRMSFCKALVLLRNQDMLNAIELMEVFFELVKIEDKHLRKFVLSSISAHLKRLYHKKKDVKILGKIQNLCFSKIKDSRSIVARAAQLICIDAFRRKFWRDERTANVIAEACFHRVAKIQVTSMKFFLGNQSENGENSDEDSEIDSEDEKNNTKTLKEVMTSFRNVKKTRKRAKNVERAKKMINKKKKAKKEGRSKECNLMAIQSIYDPQEFADKLFGMLESKKVDKFEVRLFRIALCARVIGIHRLHTLSFYSYLHRYLQPKQRDVTKILLYAAQSCHEMVPPDTVEQLLRVIANNFVTDRNSPEAMTVGINAIREILANCPFAATEELLRDLADYKTYKNKNVSMAARSLITLFRATNPRLLARKDRGKPGERGEAEEEQEYCGFARPKVHDFVQGAEVLDAEGAEDSGDVLGDDVDSDSEIEVSDVDTDEVDTDGDEDDGPVLKKRRVQEEEEEVEEDQEDEEEMEEISDEEGEFEDEEEEENSEIDDEEEIEADDEEEAEEAENPAENAKKLAETQEIDPKKKAEAICLDRILTQEDFRNIKAYQMKKQLIGEKRLKKQMGKGRSNADERIVEEMTERLEMKKSSDGLARLSDIEQFHKKKRQTKEERLADVAAGREDNDYKFGRPKKNGAHVGRTNDANSKRKVFAMVKNKVRGRNRQRSFRDQQKSLRNYLMRQNGRKPGNQ